MRGRETRRQCRAQSKKRRQRREVDKQRGKTVSIVSETDTTTQHQVMLPQKTGTKTYEMSLSVLTFLHIKPEI